MSYDGSLSYYEYYERKDCKEKPVAREVVEFPDIIVTESELPEPEIPLIEEGA